MKEKGDASEGGTGIIIPGRDSRWGGGLVAGDW